MKLHCYKKEEEYFVFTTELSEFDLVMNDMKMAESSAEEGARLIMADLEGHLEPLLQSIQGDANHHAMYKIVAMLEAMAKEGGFDLGWEHKKV